MYLHSLPFSIGFNGEAEVDSAFPVLINEETKVAVSSFRGRKLVGRTHELPTTLNVLCGRINDLKTKIDIKPPSAENLTIIEWNKADVPETQKLELGSYETLSMLQLKVTNVVVYDIFIL